MFNESIASDETDISIASTKEAVTSSSAYGFDFDGNYSPDILWHHSVSNENQLWLMEGDNSDQYRVSVDVDARSGDWRIKSAADLDADGQTDLLWHNHMTGEAEVWFMAEDGTQLVGTAAIESPNSDWGLKGVADFNQDNRADLLWHNNRTGENSVWLMGGEKGTDVLSKDEVQAIAPEWDVAGVGDFDQDSHADIVFHNDLTGESIIWFMEGENGTQLRSQSNLTQRDVDWRINGIADFNQDGQVDIFWRHRGFDNPVVWQMSAGESPQMKAEIVLPAMSSKLHPTVSGWQRSDVVSKAAVERREIVAIEPDAEDRETDNQADQEGFDIQFDYRFDTAGWFDEPKKAALETAAEIWESIILDDFENIQAGETVHASKPDGSGFEAFTLDYEIDDVVVFVYASQLEHALAEAGATTYEGSDRNTETLFQPWLGEIEFNSTESWFVDSTVDGNPDVPFGQADFLSVAVHEIGHILGISSSIKAFKSLIKNGKFTGEKSAELNNGEPIPLDRRGSHIKDGFEVHGLGEHALDPTLAKGTRKLLTILDVALLDDIGYTVDYSSLKPVPELNVLAINSRDGRDATKLEIGETYLLRWNDNFSEQVKIELYEGDRYVRTIVNDTPSDGEDIWMVPEDLAEEGYYRLKISSTEDGDVYSFSDRPFTVQAKPFLELSPLDIGPSDVDSALKTGDHLEIRWRDNLSEPLKIELYKGGKYSRTLTSSTASDGSYGWIIPSYIQSGDDYQLRLTSRADAKLYEFSETFSVARR